MFIDANFKPKTQVKIIDSRFLNPEIDEYPCGNLYYKIENLEFFDPFHLKLRERKIKEENSKLTIKIRIQIFKN